jgi:hypothetical protein
MPAVMSVLSVERVAATAVSVAVTVGVQSLSKVQHPPAAATTMLITLGGMKPSFWPWQDCPNLASGQPITSIALPGRSPFGCGPLFCLCRSSGGVLPLVAFQNAAHARPSSLSLAFHTPGAGGAAVSGWFRRILS